MTDAYDSVFRPDLFADQTIIVTGGGSGIGRCTAHELASLGAHTVLIGRKQEKLERVEAEIVEDGGEASWWTCDIRDEDRVNEVVDEIAEERGQIHALVNNAGGQFASPIVAINKKGWEAVVSTNLTGGFLMSKAVYEASMSDEGGAIVNIVADMWNGMPGMAHSGAARAGMSNFTKTAAVEWAGSGVRVNAVAPGWVASSGMDTYPDYVKATIPKLKDSVPLKRLATEAEVSAAICFLLCPAAAFVTGITMAVDGGAPMYPANFPIPDHDNSERFDGFHRGEIPEFLKDMFGDD
jgi:citronellol/citronellal dehydrogenase